MTNLDKNIAISEMMGAKTEIMYENKTSGFKDYVTFGEIVEKWRKSKLFVAGSGERMLTSNLKFDTDANWQFEAIDWIKNQGYNIDIYNIDTIETCVISKGSPNNDAGKYYTEFSNQDSNTKKEAIFEALYQFSQYLKEKRPIVQDPVTYAYGQAKAEINNFGKPKK